MAVTFHCVHTFFTLGNVQAVEVWPCTFSTRSTICAKCGTCGDCRHLPTLSSISSHPLSNADRSKTGAGFHAPHTFYTFHKIGGTWRWRRSGFPHSPQYPQSVESVQTVDIVESVCPWSSTHSPKSIHLPQLDLSRLSLSSKIIRTTYMFI